MSLPLLRIQAAASRRHGLSLQQFLGLTPSELHVLNQDALKEQSTQNQLADSRTARLLAGIYNNSMLKKKGVRYTEKDFMPKTKPKAPSTPAELINKIQAVRRAIGHGS